MSWWGGWLKAWISSILLNSKYMLFRRLQFDLKECGKKKQKKKQTSQAVIKYKHMLL